MSESYAQVDSFESDRVDAVAVGDDVIVVASGERIELVGGSERIGIDHGEPIDDVAVDDRVAVLANGELTIYSIEGDRLWNQQARDAYALAARSDSGIVGVLEPTRFRGVDLELGRAAFEVDRDRPGGPDNDELVATPTGFAIATWSFLTVLDQRGRTVFDHNLEAVIRSLGRCGDALIVALQSGQVTCLDAETGDSRWQTELESMHVAPTGQQNVLVRTADGIRDIGIDGSTEPVGTLPGGDVYATRDGGMVCSVRDGTVSTYIHRGDRIRIETLTSVVGVGSTLDVSVHNPTNEDRRVTIDAVLEAVKLSPASRTVSVAAGETEIVDFPVEAVQAEGDAVPTFEVDGTEIGGEAVSVEDAASGSIAVEPSIDPVAIKDGKVELAIALENRGGVELDTVRLLEGDESADSLPPGDSWTGTVTRPYEPERRVSVGLEVVRGDRTRQYAPTCTLPAALSIDVEPGEAVLKAIVETPPTVAVADRLLLELPGANRVRTPVTIEDDELLIVVPVTENGVARIGFEALGVTERIQMTGAGPFAEPAGPRDRDQRRSQRRSDRDRERSSQRDGRSDRTEGRDRGDRTIGTRQNSNTREPEDSASDRRSAGDGRVGTEADRDYEPVDDSAEYSEPGFLNGLEADVTIDRDVADGPVALGHIVTDELRLEATRQVEDVTVVLDGERREIGNLEPGRRALVSQSHVALSNDGLRIPPLRVEADETVLKEFPEQRLETTDRNLAVTPVIDPVDETLVAKFKNGTGQNCRVRGIRVEGETASTSISIPVQGETTTSVVLDHVSSAGPVPVAISVVWDDGTERTLETLAPVCETTGTSRGHALGYRIGSETQAAGEFSTVVLVLENEGDVPVQDVEIAASGDAIDNTFYTEARRESVPPGDWIEHFVDLNAFGDISLEATIRYRLADTKREYTIRATGPALENDEDWTDEHLKAWSVERFGANEGITTDILPDIVSTPPRIDTA